MALLNALFELIIRLNATKWYSVFILERGIPTMIHVDKKIAGNALSLPVTQRVELVELLLASLDTPDKTIDELWAKEADSRIDGFESGKIKAVSLENILSKYK
jgi:putative addiction module component (TIGR02574 family)